MGKRHLLDYLTQFIRPERAKRFELMLEKRTDFITVAIEDVYQFHNTSAVIRSCESFGVQSVHVVEHRFGERLDKNIAMGAQQWVDVHKHQNSKAVMEHLRAAGIRS